MTDTLVEMSLVVFCPEDPLPADAGWRDRAVAWFLRRLQPGFRHCFVMWRSRLGPAWIIVNHHLGRLDVLEQPDTPVEAFGTVFPHYGAVLAWMEERGLAHSVWVPRQPNHRFAPRGPMNCVSVVKHVLGIEAALILTPWQLYRRLTKPEAS